MKYRLLSIDAWAGENEWEWEWNNWFNVAMVDIDINANDQTIIKKLIDDGFLTFNSIDRVFIDDDQYNLVIKDISTLEPIYAIEYGNTL